MSFLKAMKERYTTKVYDKNKSIPQQDIEDLKEILRLSPSSINSQPWKFLFIQNETLKNELATQALYNQSKIENANCLIVFMAKSVSLFEQEMTSYLPERAIDYYNNHLKKLSTEEKQDWINRQVYLSLGVLLSACAIKNIDTTTMEGIDTNAFDDILKIKEYKTLVAVTLGVRDTENDYNQLHLSPKKRRNKTEIIEEL